jgi:hypothetical protein
MKPNYIIILALCTTLNAYAQTDATKYISNPSFETGGLSKWKSSGLQVQGNSSFSKKNGSVYVEKWVSKGSNVGDASVSQVISDLPLGKYTLTVAAQNLNEASTSEQCSGAYIYAGDQKTDVFTPNDYSVDFSCTTGEVEIGFIAKGAKGNWLAIDNFRLTLIEPESSAVIFSKLSESITKAEGLASQNIDAKALTPLLSALQTAKTFTETSESMDMQKALFALNAAISKAEFALNLANATTGDGLEPMVTKTNTYVPTGATQALMRATMTGTNILERGVCWSKEHNPTVLDDRTTEYWTLNGNIYHITNLEPATVYYLRPYVMNKTYTVAYGEEVKIVTHPKGNCTGTWDNGAPSAEANDRCRTAINQTIDYFNEWTGIKGFTLSGHYGASTQTADCSYGGWMRIGPNAGNQAIGTVLHETGHGVGVGTSDRYADTNLHNWKWYGREANKMYSFLENKEANPYTSDFCMVGDGTHAWGSSATYDWFVNGADKDKHLELQYVGGCCLLYAMFIDGLCPTTAYTNGLAGYTFNFDETKKYYLMCKNSASGLGEALLYANGSKTIALKDMLSDNNGIPDEAAWTLTYEPETGMYLFKNVAKNKYLSKRSGYMLYTTAKPADTEKFQLMPDRTDVTITTATDKLTTHGYWITGTSTLSANASNYTSNASFVTFDFSDYATKQQWIILSEDEIAKYWPATTGITEVKAENNINTTNEQTYNLNGQRINGNAKGLIIKNGKKVTVK